MMFRRWSLRFLGTALLFTGGLMPLSAQSRGYSPDRLGQLDQIGEPNQGLAKGLTKGLPRAAMAVYANTEADYLNPAFWNAPPFEDSSVQFNWPKKTWNAEDRQGDTRLKYNWLLAKWNPQHDGTGTDHFYLRFDLKRVVTNASEFTNQGQGHLGDALYAKMTGDGLLSDKAKVRIMLSVAYAKPDYMSGTVPVHLHDLTYDIVIADINGTPLNILVPGLQYGDHVLPIDFTVPTSALRFPVKADVGSEPTPAWNVVHFKLVPPKVRSPKLYTIAAYANIPATFIQYSFTMDAELTFGAIAPIFLVHGTNADPTTWEAPSGDSFVDFFTQTNGTGYLGTWDYHIDLSTGTGGNGKIKASGLELNIQLGALMKSFGAKGCHLIAHSKGGSDSRICIKKINLT